MPGPLQAAGVGTACQPARGTAGRPLQTAVKSPLFSPGRHRSPADGGGGLQHSCFSSPSYLRLLSVFLGFLGNCRHPSSFAAGTPSCLAFLQQAAPVRSSCGVASGCCSLHSVRFGRLETNRRDHRRESGGPPRLKLGFNSRHSPEKGFFTRCKGQWFPSPAWNPDLGQPHLVSCLLRKLLLFFAWLLNPFPLL